MKGRRNKPEQIIPKLREAEVELAQGLTVAEVRRVQRRLFADRGELRLIRVARRRTRSRLRTLASGHARGQGEGQALFRDP